MNRFWPARLSQVMKPATMPGLKRALAIGYDQALVAVVDALKTEGFGVLTEIDIQNTLQNKLGVAFRRYKILGACNPPLAHRALQADLDVGLMLPCNIVVYEDDQHHAVVTAIDPMQTVAAHHPALLPIAEEVRGKLTRVLERLG
jgi:uncharacterized protein (DUF302 family)